MTAWYDDSLGGMEVLKNMLNFLNFLRVIFSYFSQTMQHFASSSFQTSVQVSFFHFTTMFEKVLRLRNQAPPPPQRVDDKTGLPVNS